jgi:hypothetical protein
MCGEPTIGDGFWKMKARILDGEEVTSFVWARSGGVRNDAVIWVTVGSEELPRSWEREEVTNVEWVGSKK